VLKSFSAEVVEPQSIPLIAFPLAWSPAVNLPLAEVVYLDAKDEADLARLKAKLRGKIVMFVQVRALEAQFGARATRLSEKELLALADAGESGASEFAMRLASPFFQQLLKNRIFFSKQLQFLSSEGAALIVSPSRGDGGAIFAERAGLLLAPGLGRERAVQLVAEAVAESRRSGTSFTAVVASMAERAGAPALLDDLCALRQQRHTRIHIEHAGKIFCALGVAGHPVKVVGGAAQHAGALIVPAPMCPWCRRPATNSPPASLRGARRV
jgi:hypothetical protein